MLQARLTGVWSGAPGHLMATVVSDVVQARSVTHRHHYGTTRKTPSSESAAPASIPIRLRHFLTYFQLFLPRVLGCIHLKTRFPATSCRQRKDSSCCCVSFGGHKEALLACFDTFSTYALILEKRTLTASINPGTKC